MTLYHASQLKDLKHIQPQRTLSNNKYIGDYVFATENKVLAAMYLVPKGFATLMESDTANPELIICGKEQDLRAKDKGGAIYELPDDTFKPTPQEGLELYEKISEKPVVPLKAHAYQSIFDAFNEQRITVRFVNKKTFLEIIDSSKS